MAFDKDIPTAGTSLRASNPQILENQESTQEAVDNEHIFTGTSAATQTGDHTQGSARCFSQASAPATRIDGNLFLSTDLGSLWVDTDDNAMYILTATTPTWTPISTEVIATLLAANRVFAGTLGVDGNFEVGTGSEFTVAAASGNVLADGTLEATGLTTVADGSLTKTNAAPSAGSAEIANAKYVDDQITSNVPVASRCKAWATVASDGTLLDSFNVTSSAKTDDGDYTITWDTDFSTNNYAVVVSCDTENRFFINPHTKAVGTCKVTIQNNSGSSTDLEFSIIAFGTQ